MSLLVEIQRNRIRIRVCLFALVVCAVAAQAETIVYVGGSGTGHYSTVQAAVNALPSTGGEVEITAGTYKEQVTVSKPSVRLIGEGSTAASTVIYDDLYSSKSDGSGGTLGDKGSSTIIVTSAAKNFYMYNLEAENTYTQEGNTEQPALALYIAADRAVLSDVRLIGRQDTIYLGSQGCTTTTCTAARQYIYGSYIEGNVDFVFGDGAAVFDTCTFMIDEHSSVSGEAVITAQNKKYTNYLSGYVFYKSTIEAASSAMTSVYFGRPWGKYSTHILVDNTISAPIKAAGWIEFTPGTTDYLPTSTYAEYGSTGTGAAGYKAKTREEYVTYLTASEANDYLPDTYLAGSDSWEPTTVD